LEENTYHLEIDAVISELNLREIRVWSEVKVSSSGWTSDKNIWRKMTLSKDESIDLGYPDLGENYKWKGNEANRDGESYLSYKQGSPAKLKRAPSTAKNPGRWLRK